MIRRVAIWSVQDLSCREPAYSSLITLSSVDFRRARIMLLSNLLVLRDPSPILTVTDVSFLLEFH